MLFCNVHVFSSIIVLLVFVCVLRSLRQIDNCQVSIPVI